MDAPLHLHEVIELLERRYPPATAESWDAVGLVAGEPGAPVRRVLFAVDPTEEVVAEAAAAGADLLVTHHPLLLRPVNSVAATTPKGRVLHRLITEGIALYVAHTNADSAAGGVNDALADALDLVATRPLVPAPGRPLDVLVVHVPEPDAEAVREALAAAGAGAVGDYSGCAWSTGGVGEFTPRAGANPAIGMVGSHERVAERRMEMVVPPGLRDAVTAALREAHPYEEPAFSFLATHPPSAHTGSGRLGRLTEPTTLGELAARVVATLPATAQGVRVSGDLTASVEMVAVCGGSGDAYLGAAHRAGADVYITADLRHHRAGEAREADGAPFLIDAAHWATEWPWLPVAARALDTDSAGRVETIVSTRVTDPWTLRLGAANTGGNL
ncbi:Nif3-like dinuclear metal center hexameric protein [Ruania halotolerans]|uniref:Nif3-like dinuclear metal center hexameric protein n=1 Tax=Ruania halotolerans TaxID=2897773 RepID=UPI001E4CB02E|nr:Nif3-like dinuclear metal center hexameric protein [Ruania halotolerans]UFU04871.1 Nif3-like dinuclear metal center hexameric protein [Ruania halotolerans]